MFPPMMYFNNDSVKNLYQYCLGPLFYSPYMYRALKLTLHLDIGFLSRDSTIKNEMGTGSVKQAVGILITAMFSAEERP